MNATEDGAPLGEGPIDTLGAIERGAVLGILSAADEVLATKQLAERQTQALNKVRELHRLRTGRAVGFGDMPDEDFCAECSTVGQHIPYPCPTIRALDEAGA
ncbi:hypothetical protein BN970_03334 [Mycolicibacterium conceptionense]|uniref:Uncharacterized protein n=1 Tax=Mycolicibacterium conceptionense TaxID=451644 RepID=A0A0U1DHJ2_9MYCO|nr:hypothetical protein [Mycolicibacterium conceptionense]CQD15825.1 hypothetical protein BN970_03334 [Mycolicibacterium conceptionense]